MRLARASYVRLASAIAYGVRLQHSAADLIVHTHRIGVICYQKLQRGVKLWLRDWVVRDEIRR